MASFSPLVSFLAAHEYVRAPADMHPRLVGVTSSNITNTRLNSPRISRASSEDVGATAGSCGWRGMFVEASSAGEVDTSADLDGDGGFEFVGSAGVELQRGFGY